jgi:hypothetical protein
MKIHEMKTYLMDPMGTSRQMTSRTSPRGLAGHRKAKIRAGISIVDDQPPNKQKRAQHNYITPPPSCVTEKCGAKNLKKFEINLFR